MTPDIEARVRRANPLTDDHLAELFGKDVSHRLLRDVYSKKEGRMTPTQPDRDPGRGAATFEPDRVSSTQVREAPGRPRLRIALVALVVVVAAATVPLLLTRGGGGVATATSVGEEFVTATSNWDSQTALGLLAADVEFEGIGPVTTTDDYEMFLEWLRAIEWRWTLDQCSSADTEPPTAVTCTMIHENAWSRALGVGPFDGMRFELEVSDGEIQHVNRIFDTQDFSPQVWEPFTAWLRENHPEDVLTVLTDGCCQADVGPEAVTLWEQFTREFVAEQEPAS